MDPLLTELNAVPGVVGSMVCSAEGTILAHAFPPVFAASALAEAARAVTDSAQAAGVGQSEDGVLDLRFREVRLLARPVAGGILAVLCSRSTNLQLLLLSAAAAAGKLGQDPGAAGEPPAAPEPAHPLPPVAPRASRSGVAAPASGLAELRRRLAAPPGPAEPARGPDARPGHEPSPPGRPSGRKP